MAGQGRPSQLPDSMKMTMREFKKLKRKQFKALKKALDEFNQGSIFMPHGSDITNMCREFDSIGLDLKKWWEKA